MVNNYVKLNIRKDTKELLLKSCVEEYRKYHPEIDKIPITQDKILYEVCRFYLK